MILPGGEAITPGDQFWWNWTVQAVGALATLGAVAVALFGSWIHVRLWPSSLSISLRDSSDVAVETVLQNQLRTLSRWCHIRVENARRWTPARDVRVLLQRLEEADSAGTFQVSWIGEVPLAWSHQGFKSLALLIGGPEEADLCSVTKNATNPIGPHSLELHPLFRSFTLRAKWESACKFAVILQARGVEYDSNILRVEIAWDGKWSDDAAQMTRHLVISSVAI